ncbi:Nudix hydrolase 2 [Morus notabilis]|uniref:Nudix hydrolase 2 n=1 Tax=Morus notabilis TaxID=981085 RepID=W9SC18_9ROSA|nr:Nudix hydrolase 2 [Morus notabilis]
MAENAAPLLSAVNDLHGGVRVEMKEPINPQEFGVLLRASMSQWRAQEKKGIWIKLPIELANLVEIAVKEGFRYHHAESDYLMLVHWIPVTADTLPANASHSVGIGAFVMKDNGEVLVVQEKTGRFKGLGVWKYPTGVVNEGEDICTAAIREVKEETGIDTEFVEVLAFRESHKLLFTKSDLFFVCMLKPRSFDIQIQVVEIEAAKWMPVEEYEAQPFIQNHKLFNLVAKICRAKSVADYTGFSPWSTTTASGKTTSLYFNNQYIDRIQSSAASALKAESLAIDLALQCVVTQEWNDFLVGFDAKIAAEAFISAMPPDSWITLPVFYSVSCSSLSLESSVLTSVRRSRREAAHAAARWASYFNVGEFATPCGNYNFQ